MTNSSRCRPSPTRRFDPFLLFFFFFLRVRVPDKSQSQSLQGWPSVAEIPDYSCYRRARTAKHSFGAGGVENCCPMTRGVCDNSRERWCGQTAIDLTNKGGISNLADTGVVLYVHKLQFLLLFPLSMIPQQLPICAASTVAQFPTVFPIYLCYLYNGRAYRTV